MKTNVESDLTSDGGDPFVYCPDPGSLGQESGGSGSIKKFIISIKAYGKLYP